MSARGGKAGIGVMTENRFAADIDNSAKCATSTLF
jgi:hypothetical protein